MNQIERISIMEERYDRVVAAVGDLRRALEQYVAVQADLAALAEYADGGDWLTDFEADEAGLLPEGLKRGVLSEDGLYDLLDEASQLATRLGAMGEDED
ncbi:MAG: DUF4298 domain-containing protein [Bacteroidales bacterium]|nr:DUF4298 domain-containing protein [Bacteroidales bacterium]